MMMTGAPCSATTPRHVGIALQAPHVIDDRRSQIERPGGDGGFERIDRDRDAERDDLGQYRSQPRAFLLDRHANGAAIGPRRFRADIENIGAFGGEAAGMGDRRLRIEKAAAVGKRIRRDVEHAHDQRPRLGEKLRQHVAAGAGSAPGSCEGSGCGHRLAVRRRVARASLRPKSKQSSSRAAELLDCFVASLLAMTLLHVALRGQLR